MTNPLMNWWRSQKFRGALKGGDRRLAQKLLQEIQKSGAKLSPSEKLFKKQLKLEKSLKEKEREIASLSKLLKEANQEREIAELQENFGELDFNKFSKYNLTPNPEFVEFVWETFKIAEIEENLLQCTGIDARVFDALEFSLAKYIDREINREKNEETRTSELKKAIADLKPLKRGKDPKYDCIFTPHAYMIRYFLDHTYSSYLAWFLLYKEGLLPSKINILDIAAGPGTVAYGLASFLHTARSFFSVEPMHISYYSLEKQKLLQYGGLQFWRQYIEGQEAPTNAYFRFDTTDIFTYDSSKKKLPPDFFDFVVISHCIFANPQQRIKSNEIYRKIFEDSLKSDGYVMVIIQVNRLFNIYGFQASEDSDRERELIEKLLTEMGLKLVWYKYLTSTGQRISLGAGFAKFAQENLPLQKQMSKLQRQYLGLNYDSNYVIDDYVILAKR